MRKPPILAKFKIYPEPGCKPNWYYEVYVFRSLNAMYYFNKWSRNFCRRDYVGLCMPSAPGDHWSRKFKLGEIDFAPPHLTSDIIAHECAHACLKWYSRVDGTGAEIELDPAHREKLPNNEEFIAYVVGELVRQVHKELYDAKLL